MQSFSQVGKCKETYLHEILKSYHGVVSNRPEVKEVVIGIIVAMNFNFS